MSILAIKSLVATTAIAVALVAFVASVTSVSKSTRKRFSIFDRLVCFAFLFAAVMYGGAKSITFPATDPSAQYLIDRGSYVTNDFVHVDFTVAPGVPNSAQLLIERRVGTSTNDADWVVHETTTIGAFNPPRDIAYVCASNYDWMVYTTWTPGPAVQTNGVWHAYWGNDRITKTLIIPARTAVRLEGDTIATPQSVWNSTNTTEVVP